ncbi:HAD-like domain-containing protein [Usnea florida]
MPSLQEGLGFTGRPETHSFSGVLLDMDGTIVDSTDAIVKHWHKIGKELGVDPTVILQSSHGRRSIDTMQLYDPSKANWGYVSHVEGLIPKEFGADAVEVPGARELLASLEAAKAPWAIVTSGTRPLVTGWLDVMRLAHPRNLVVAEDVEEGKPDPECYALGRAKLGLRVDTKVLVVEDSPAGIRAGKAASSFVVALVTTHTIAQLRENEPDWIVKDLQSIRLVNRNAVTGEVVMEISNWLE